MLLIDILLAFPAGGGEGGSGGGISYNMIFLGGILVVFWLFFIRPQAKKAREQKNFLGELKKGDRVVTSGGILGKITKVEETVIIVEVDSNTKLKMLKSAVNIEASKSLGEPAEEKK